MPRVRVQIVTTGAGGTMPDPIHISVRRNDQVEWRCTQPFTISRINCTQQVGCNAPNNPFRKALPINGARGRAFSGRARAQAVGHEYKTTIRVGRFTIDPHIIIIP